MILYVKMYLKHTVNQTKNNKKAQSGSSLMASVDPAQTFYNIYIHTSDLFIHDP